ncbi:LOW QUALITY PROTEIN: probable receptor-like protein kinase At2g23200 [Eutrema salsugineum]|uniref:LOW QUALITY PROTEIN: probable receptor-like protein kinase At2g23200 n=1 Tax=Eutrema salsugineum TaxID=72664 RepID=UPI000CED351F|nr:LOW QUALITY PROTEIN: probable receptor-like protein kinase At2g23200 [Eutrema salsugineum]
MEKLCFRNSFSRFMTTVVIVLLPRCTLSATSTYSHRPEKFYVNCGSDSIVTYGGRTFVGDMISGGNSVSFNSKGTEAINQSGSGIYETVRIFRRPSSYKFQLDSIGLHFVRLHFSAVSSRTELLTARFTVSATSHLKSFSLQNFNETPRVEEFLLMIDSPEFEIRFVPYHSSMAFVNAIEVFSAPNDLEIPSDSDKNLHTVYRLNVGGKNITPENDTLGRTWSVDEDFLYEKDSARNINSTQKPNYESGTATPFTAPDFVYQTAKTMNHSSNEGMADGMLMNVTWSFKVNSNSRHFIRVHFCDIKSESQNPDSDFYLYVNGQSRLDVKPSERIRLVTPFFKDVNVSDGFGLLNVTIGTKDSTKDAGFLNGLEVMEFLKKSDSSDKSSFRVYIIAGCVVAASVLVLSLLFTVFLKRRRSKKENKSDAEVTEWSPLPLYRGGGSSDNRPSDPVNNSPLRSNRTFDPVHNSPLRNLNLGLTIPFIDIMRATNNFDEQWLIGRGGFGDVYKAILQDGSKAAIKRGKSGSGQGLLEFQTEIQVLSRIRHRHLVSLTGYCEENSEMILVYEFMEKGTLKEHLYGSDLPSLTWKQRLEICIGAARGLHYLHSGSEGAIIHRDVKSTNILLDENTVAKVADFGLSNAVRNQDPINISTNIKGTFGYLDPEYLQTHILTEKSDVYAFGVVLLEVLCARSALDPSLPHEEVNLAEWAMFCKSKGIIDEILDPKLIGQIEPSSLRKYMEIAEKCLKEYGDERPSMGDVIWDLEYVLQLQMMPIRREPHEDSAATISGGGGESSLVIPRLMVSDSFSSNSIVQKNEGKSSYGGTDSSESRVFSQLKISEAR